MYIIIIITNISEQIRCGLHNVEFHCFFYRWLYFKGPFLTIILLFLNFALFFAYLFQSSVEKTHFTTIINLQYSYFPLHPLCCNKIIAASKLSNTTLFFTWRGLLLSLLSCFRNIFCYRNTLNC